MKYLSWLFVVSIIPRPFLIPACGRYDLERVSKLCLMLLSATTLYLCPTALSAQSVSAPVLSLPSGAFASAQTVSITDATSGANIYYTTDGTVPTSSSTLYVHPISVTSTETIEAVAIASDTPSALAAASYTIATKTPLNAINFSQGFPSAGVMQLNGDSCINPDGCGAGNLLLTNDPYQASSAFYPKPVNIQSFTTVFNFLQAGTGAADGFTFTIQNIGPGAIGDLGKALGYAPIGKSAAIKFDLYNNAGEGPNSTGLYVDGALPTVPAIDLTGTGINLHSSVAFSYDTLTAQITYDGTNLNLTITDTNTLAHWSHSFPIDIPATVGGDTAYVGFTGGTGTYIASQSIPCWTYISGSPGPPAPPPSLPPGPDYPAGFNPVGLSTNGSAEVMEGGLLLTPGGKNQAGSAFYTTPVTIDQSFTTDFTFQLLSEGLPGISDGDGITFTILNAEPYVVPAGFNALGADGGALGFEGIANNASGGYKNFDMAIKFDIHNNAGEGSNSTGLYVNGASPTVPAIDLTGTGINLDIGNDISPHLFDAHITYDYPATTLTLTLTDTVTAAKWSHAFNIDIPKTIGGVTAYIGFTGSTGMAVESQAIETWTFTTP